MTIPLRIDDLAYWNQEKQQFTVEPETIGITIGSSSDAPKFSGRVQIVP